MRQKSSQTGVPLNRAAPCRSITSGIESAHRLPDQPFEGCPMRSTPLGSNLPAVQAGFEFARLTRRVYFRNMMLVSGSCFAFASTRFWPPSM